MISNWKHARIKTQKKWYKLVAGQVFGCSNWKNMDLKLTKYTTVLLRLNRVGIVINSMYKQNKSVTS